MGDAEAQNVGSRSTRSPEPGGVYSTPPVPDTGKDLYTRTEVEALLHELEDARRQLAVNEERLALALESAAAAIWEWDAATDEFTWNSELERLWGLRPGALRTYADWLQVVHPDDLERAVVERDAAIAQRRAFNTAFRAVLPGGGLCWVASRGKGIYSDTGELVRVTGLNQDVTEFHRKIEDLRFAMTVVETMRDAVLWAREDGRIVYVNNAASALLGYSRDELMSKHAYDLAEGRSATTWRAHWRMLHEQEVANLVFRYRRKDGTTVPVELQTHFVDFEGNLYAYGSVRDISERVAMEEALRLNQADMLALLENTDSSIWSIDRDYRLTAGNSVFRRNFRAYCDHEPVIGERIPDILADEQVKAELMKHFERALRGERFILQPERHRGEQSRLVEYRFSPVRGDDGMIKGVTVLGSDVTDQLRATQVIEDQLAEISLYYDTAPVGLAILDTELRCVRVNEMLAGINGRPVREHIGKSIEEVSPALAHLARQYAAEVLTTGRPITNVEVNSPLPSELGGMRHWLLSWHPLRRDRGEIFAFSVLVEDITERKEAVARLELSRQRLERAQEIGQMGSWEWDVPTGRFNWSEGLYRISGVEKDLELTYANIESILHPEDLPAIRTRIHKALAADDEAEFEFRIVRPDDVIRQMYVSTKVMRDEHGEPERLFGIVQDVTERKRVEEALRRSQHNLREAERMGNSGSWDYDVATNTTVWSENMFRIFVPDMDVEGRELLAGTGLINSFFQDMVHPDDRERLLLALYAAFGDEAPYDVEYRIVRKDGELRDIHATAEVVRNENGEPVNMVGRVEDITERKRVEAALRHSEANLNEAERVSNTGSFDYDIVAGKVTWSVNMHRLLDEPEPNLGEPFIRTRVHPDDREKVSDALAAALVEGNVIDAEFRIVRNDGRVRDIHVVSETTLDGQGIGHIEDVTERNRAAVEREQLHAQLAQAQKMESVGRLAGGIAHDFNNMLAVMMLRTEMSLDVVETGTPLHQNLTAVYTTAQRSANLVKQLLGYARKQVIMPTVLDLNAAVEGMLPMLRKLIGEEVEVSWAPGANLWSVKMDASQIDQIVTNLCVNGRDAIDGIGTIFIATANVTLPATRYDAAAGGGAAGDYVAMSVTDTGSGMEPEILEHIFEPFYTTKEFGKGIGLGLATVDGIVHQNDGHIKVTSKPGAGTTFTIYVPRYSAPIETQTTEAKTVPQTLAGKTVLLVEDDEIVLDMAAEVLRMFGHTVLATLSPNEALRIAERHTGPIDLLLTDVVMPEMNGGELARRVRQSRPAIAVLFMSGYPDKYVAHRGVLPDDTSVLAKPFSVSTLRAKIAEALGEGVRGFDG